MTSCRQLSSTILRHAQRRWRLRMGYHKASSMDRPGLTSYPVTSSSLEMESTESYSCPTGGSPEVHGSSRSLVCFPSSSLQSTRHRKSGVSFRFHLEMFLLSS